MIQTTLFPDTFRQIFSLSNDEIGNVFEQVADLLEAQGDDYYRIRAYRKGAQSVRQHSEPVVDVFEAAGTQGLEQLPYIGKRLASAIEELAKTGEFSLLARLLIDVSPEDIFTTVPGIGQVLARRVYRGLGVKTLEGLAQAAGDGRLAQVPGFGTERVGMVRDSLATRLGLSLPQVKRRSEKGWRSQAKNQPIELRSVQTTLPVAVQPDVSLLLQVDEQYRHLAKAGQLRMIKPKRFNPEGKSWLPVMRLNKGGWSFNALYSNTARAHELGKTDDWVVIYYERDEQQGQYTVVTETQGVKKGQRVVRGLTVAAA
ncbi:MAG: helix-hairpin-helix domain-containing protein [Cyanobacteria bacterium J06560_2]